MWCGQRAIGLVRMRAPLETPIFYKFLLAFWSRMGHYNLAASRGGQMVGVAQLAERWVVAPEVEGSSPFAHPIIWLSYNRIWTGSSAGRAGDS